jgi:hypothetical protein
MRLARRALGLCVLSLLLIALSVTAGRWLPSSAQLAYSAQTDQVSRLKTVLLDSGRALAYDLRWPHSTGPLIWLDHDRLLLTSTPFQYLVFIVGEGVRSIEEPRMCASILIWGVQHTACSWVGRGVLVFETDCLLRGCADEPRALEVDVPIYTLVWSPQHDQLALIEWSSTGYALHRLALADGSLERLLPRGSVFLWPLNWSPDGERLAICESEANTLRLRIISASDGHDLIEPRPLTGSPFECEPVWSLDSHHVLIAEAIAGGGTQMVALTVETGAVRTLYENTRELLLPQWSADGREIIYYERDGQTLSLFALTLDSGAVRRLSDERQTLINRPFVWRPMQP